MKPHLIDKAVRLLVEGHGTKRVRDTIEAIITRDARMRRRARPPVFVKLVGAGVNVTQEDPRIADCERAVREALGF